MIRGGGFVKLYRQIQEHPLWTSEPASRAQAWIDLIMLAAYEPHPVSIGEKSVPLDRGDLAASVRFLAKRWKWSVCKTVSFLDRLHVDNQLVKKQNGSGNGSPSIYHIENYAVYQGGEDVEQDGSKDARRTVPERLQYETKKGKKVKEASDGFASLPFSGQKSTDNNPENQNSASWESYRQAFVPGDQDILKETAEAIARTRKSGKVARSVLDRLAGSLSRYAQPVVIRSCGIYLNRDCASGGKNERYLLGIVRSESKRDSDGRPEEKPASQTKTESQLAMERALRERARELEQENKN